MEGAAAVEMMERLEYLKHIPEQMLPSCEVPTINSL